MTGLILLMVGYFVGVDVSLILFRPLKSFDAGYEAAKEMYISWNTGFDAGWDEAVKSIEEVARGKWRREEEGD